MSDSSLFKQLGLNGGNDPLRAAIQKDMEGLASPLALMARYLDEAKASLENDPPAFAKLAWLFEHGTAPGTLPEHCFGVTLGLRTGGLKGFLQRRGNILNFLWGKLLAAEPPWVGKGFIPLDGRLLPRYLDGQTPAAPHMLGINYFRREPTSLLNRLSMAVLSVVLRLKALSKEESRKYGCDKTGGSFIGRRAPSVKPGLGHKEVFQINYRFPALRNPFPLQFLIDEMVEIAPGLHLGHLLGATRRLFTAYHPAAAEDIYNYQLFGYFLLMDERWNEERRRLFPYTEDLWRSKASSIDWVKEPKYSRLTLAGQPDGAKDDALFAQVKADKEGMKTVLDLLKLYADQAAADKDVHSPAFAKLGELFNRAAPPRDMEGYYHGSVIAFRNEGWIKTFDVNTLNLIWPLVRPLSHWTGKTFEEISAEQLRAETDGAESLNQPFRWGTNTYAERTAGQKAVVEAMRLLDMRLSSAPRQERLRGYDVKSFFFIGKQAKTVNPDNGGKTVYQFNYRWPKLKTFPPDNFCIDELVQLAEGLYMGQLLYATELLLEPYDHKKPPAAYAYKNFGYFLLMDDEWQVRKLEIGFDTPA